MNKIEEKELLLSVIGILTALEHSSITIEESESYLFSPRIINQLKKDKTDNRIIEIIEECCELEDIESLIPNRLNDTISDLRERSLKILDSYETIDDINWK